MSRAEALAKAAMFCFLGAALFLTVQFALGTMVALGVLALAILAIVALSYR